MVYIIAALPDWLQMTLYSSAASFEVANCLPRTYSFRPVIFCTCVQGPMAIGQCMLQTNETKPALQI